MNIGTGSLLMFGMSMLNKFETQREEWKDRIRAEWKNSANYPRKKKKRVRKELILDWAFACYDPFESFKFK